jgi:hypothetical protein
MGPNDALDLGIQISIIVHKTQEVLKLESERLSRMADERDVDDRLSAVSERIRLFLPDVPVDSEVCS